jgi:hypothetical protein
VLGLAVMLALAASASAAPKTDTFTVVLDGANGLLSGDGTGWDNQFVYYPNTDWWNMWFYDDPPDPARYKHFTYDITLYMELTPTLTEVAINWSTLAYGPNPGQPPIPPMTPDEEQAQITRYVIYSGQPAYGEHLVGEFYLRGLNPEWVSFDMRNYASDNLGTMAMGTITHECLPEPATLSVLALGGLGVLLRRKRK